MVETVMRMFYPFPYFFCAFIRTVVVADLVLWQPPPLLTRKPGRRSNYHKLLCEETGRDETQLRIDANDRDGWRKVVRNM